MNFLNKRIILLMLAMQLMGCAALDGIKEKFSPSKTMQSTNIPAAWQAIQNKLPHAGKVDELKSFWQQYDDVVLVDLIAAAQQESATLASAKTRIAEAKLSRVSADAARLPTLDASFSASRAVQQPDLTFAGGGVGGGGFSGATDTYKADLQAAWELDLFGKNANLFDAASARESAFTAGWHEARVAVAAELASAYFDARYCGLQLALQQKDTASRKETARLTAISQNAGFAALSAVNLADASVADAAQQITAQQAQCDGDIKALVALTGLEESVIKQKLDSTAFVADADVNAQRLALTEVPAEVISQRPDIYSAEADLMSAAAEIKNTVVQQYPKVSLNGSIGWMALSGVGFSGNGKVWSIGPVSITLPIYHAGVNIANIASAEAKYEEAAANYRSKVRTAIKEVESSLVTLHSAAQQQTELNLAIKNYQANLKATDAKVKAGFANLIELEQSRRDALQAETNLISLYKARSNAWVALYRAAGGGWSRANNTAATETTTQLEKK